MGVQERRRRAMSIDNGRRGVGSSARRGRCVKVTATWVTRLVWPLTVRAASGILEDELEPGLVDGDIAPDLVCDDSRGSSVPPSGCHQHRYVPLPGQLELNSARD